MRRGQTFSRRELIKLFGPLAFLLFPVTRAMGYVAGGPFVGAPRFVMFFKGPAYQSPSVRPASVDDLGSTPLAPILPHKSDVIVFQEMHTTGGRVLGDVYQEEHAGGLFGCVTGNDYHYYENNSYMAYTDNESFNITVANSYASRPELSKLPFSSLHLGAGAQSDCDGCGLGQRYISFTKTQRGSGSTDYYDNAIEPIQDSAQVYDMLMQRVSLLCTPDSNQPVGANTAMIAALKRKQSVVDFRLEDIADAKRLFGMNFLEHARRLDGLVDGWRAVESANQAQLDLLEQGGTTGGACPTNDGPSGNGQRENDLDELSPVHDQMIDLIKLAFEWDLTRVVAFTLSGASSGQRWPSKGITQAHHSLEHGGATDDLNLVDTYFSQKFARLLAALKDIDDGDGHHALFNSAVLLGQECWSNGGHYLKDIPYVLAGNGAGAWNTGRVVQAGGRSNNDLMVSIQNACGIPSATWGKASLNEGPII